MSTSTGMAQDTSKSDQMVQRLRQSRFQAKRQVQKLSGTFETTAEKLFALLCPAREADWIPGWDCELVYTQSGYAEEDCVFRTDPANVLGAGTWILTNFQANRRVDCVRFEPDQVTHARITLTVHPNETVTMDYELIHTALTEKGNQKIERMAETEPHFPLLIKMLDHYLKTGTMIDRAALVKGN